MNADEVRDLCAKEKQQRVRRVTMRHRENLKDIENEIKLAVQRDPNALQIKWTVPRVVAESKDQYATLSKLRAYLEDTLGFKTSTMTETRRKDEDVSCKILTIKWGGVS